jgi:hypothetical protein
VDDWLRRAHTEWSERLDRLDAHLADQSAATISEETRNA